MRNLVQECDGLSKTIVSDQRMLNSISVQMIRYFDNWYNILSRSGASGIGIRYQVQEYGAERRNTHMQTKTASNSPANLKSVPPGTGCWVQEGVMDCNPQYLSAPMRPERAYDFQK